VAQKQGFNWWIILYLSIIASVIGLVMWASSIPPSPEQAARREREEAARREAEAAEQAKREQEEAAKRQAEEAERRRKEEAKRQEEFDSWAGLNALVGCKTELKSQLKDPGSYQDDWATPTPQIDREAQAVTFMWEFRAKNSFGGYDTAIAVCKTKPGPDGMDGYGIPDVAISQ